jgi:hypothetical protein
MEEFLIFLRGEQIWTKIQIKGLLL